MSEQLRSIDGIELCVEGFGRQDDPAILLVMGATASMIWWETEFCQRLADKGYFVIRYDNRDVGRSTTYEVGSPGYTFEDMADDAVRVLDSFGIKQAHIVGMSMGGLLTQIVALRHTDRVLSISLVMTSNFAPHLPPMEEKVAAFFSNAGSIDWTDEQAVVASSVEKWKVLRGSKHSWDREKIEKLTREEFKRARNIASMNNHAFVTGAETYVVRTHEIPQPTLVIHGTEDPIIPYVHGVHLANTVPGAALLTLTGTGHELHEQDWDAMIEAICAHTAAAK
ncbi:alpha/beta fold hydrolase [Brevibacillus choshinensis]|uniref:Alpha/beta hydrolase n=1 Tax=Brevibacillus choshinensis TaxID=54911 RepID=A0ABX7FTQ9_BRECH|nr:alpha/beta hydrolase [Brevibacillus choshinensis]QRG68662.1 alpha/beta hydrolase [Brevibacillus choshinensis]